MLKKPRMKQRSACGLAAMIIGMALFFPLSVGAAEGLPSPISFVNSMELGDVSQAEAWLDAGLSPDFMGSRIGSGLMIGAWEGNLKLMQLFVERGANINRVNAAGESALALAALRGQTEAVNWLIDHGAQINGKGRQWSALHYAVFSGHEKIADLLLAKGADIDAVSTNGSTPLMMAVYEGRESLARKLIEKGADRAARNDWDDGALEWAMRYNRLGIARMVTNPEEFNIAVSQPKEKWGAPQRSLRTSKELEDMLAMREQLVEKGQSTVAIDKRIAAERMRIVRSELGRQAPVARSATLEISASRKKPQEQSANIVYDDKGKAVGYKVPAATYQGTPKMPIKGNVKNY
jgi:uncharacterized protein